LESLAAQLVPALQKSQNWSVHYNEAVQKRLPVSRNTSKIKHLKFAEKSPKNNAF
jgi:hypothetical protein